MNLPNSLTLSRIFLVPLMVVVLLTRVENFELWGVAVLLAAALTDWLDGRLARSRRQVTTLGVVLDPIADKLLIAAAFITLVEMRLAPAWMVVLIVGREVAVLGMRLVARGEGFAVPVSELGKAKMVLQVCAAALLILASRYPALLLPGTVALWLVLLFALISAARYLVQFWRGLEAASRQSAPLVIVRPNDEEREERDVAAQQR